MIKRLLLTTVYTYLTFVKKRLYQQLTAISILKLPLNNVAKWEISPTVRPPQSGPKVAKWKISPNIPKIASILLLQK